MDTIKEEYTLPYTASEFEAKLRNMVEKENVYMKTETYSKSEVDGIVGNINSVLATLVDVEV